MKHRNLSIICCAIMAAGIAGNAFGAGFIHPGISHNQAELAFVKSKLKTQEQPWQESWEKMRSSKEADLSWKPKPIAHVERGANNRPNIGGSFFMNDARAAYTHMLLWIFTDTEAHALKAAEILNAWSSTLESVSNHDAKLLVGMGGLQFCNAAELLKHTWNGWSQEDQEAFRLMLQKVLYPVIQDFFPAANGNWDASMIQTMMAMGIFLDDHAMFQKAVDYYLNGVGNGAVNHYFYDSGQCQESGRDQGHTQMGMEYLVNSAEIAWKQGVDLYSAYDNRLSKGFEYTAKYNQGNDVPFEYYESYQGKYKHMTIAEKSRGRLRPMYDKIVNHYHNRMGMDMPWCQKALEKTRPETGGTMPWSTLMYADQPSGLVKLAAQIVDCSAFAQEIHVATNGSDTNKGTASSPFATLGAAQNALHQTGRLGKEPCTVVIHAGTYRLGTPLVFGPADSGSEEAPVVYRAAADEEVIVTGAQLITSPWEAWKDGIVRTQVGKMDAIDQFFVDGKRQHMARYPNYGAGFVPAGRDQSRRGTKAGTPPYEGCTPNAWDASKAAEWKNPAGAFMHGMHGGLWGSQHYRVLGKNANGSLHFEGGWQNNRAGSPHASYRMIENVFEELDAPGEWFHDTKEGYLYYKPAKNMDMASTSFEVVLQIRHLVEIYGDVKQPVAEMDIQNSGNRLDHTVVKTYETIRSVKNIRIEGIRFTGTARTFMETKEPLLRSDWSIYRGGAIHLRGTEAITIEKCDFEELGGNAVFVDGYNRNVIIRGNHFKNNGASDLNFVGSFAAVRDPAFSHGAAARPLDEVDTGIGPKSDEYPADCLVEDNLMTRCGRFEKQTSGVNISMSSRITVRHNTISQSPRAAINVCDGTWGGHMFEWNDCFETVLETHDHGAFNSWGRDRYWHRAGTSGPAQKDKNGIPLISHWIKKYPNAPRWDAYQTSIIRNNRMHCDHGWGIDLDDGSTNYEIYNNLCLSGGLKTREGYYRIVTNNVAIGNVYTCNVPYPKPTHDQFERNVLWGKGYRSTKPLLWGGTRNYNFMHGPDATETGPATVLQAQSKDDPDSLYGNARFVAPEKGDFSVASDSPALRVGFKNFPMTGFGVSSARLKAQAGSPTIRLPEEVASNRLARAKTKQLLGANIKSLTTDGEVSAAGMYSKSGVILISVSPKSQMALFGFRADDVVLEIDDIKTSNDGHLVMQLQNLQAGKHTAKVWRAQEPHTFSFTK